MRVYSNLTFDSLYTFITVYTFLYYFWYRISSVLLAVRFGYVATATRPHLTAKIPRGYTTPAFTFIIVWALSCWMLVGCSDYRYDNRLQVPFELVECNPRQVLNELDKIDINDLSPIDRKYYFFIQAKANDRAGIPNSSVSEILDAANYFSRHNTKLYPEALLYVSRTFRSLGDYPAAIAYSQKALPKICERNLTLKRDVFRELGTLHAELMFYDTAISYLNKALCVDSLTSDTSGFEYDRSLINCYRRQSYAYANNADNHAKKAMIEGAYFNYINEHREQGDIIAEKNRYEYGLVIIGFLCYGLLVYGVCLRLRARRQQLELREAITNLKLLKQSLNNPGSEPPINLERESKTELREKLRKQLLELYNTAGTQQIDSRIIQSSTYAELQNQIQNGSAINENSQFWMDIENLVASVSPNFRTHLQLLTGGKLTQQDLHTALLIKCGIKPTQMGILLARTKGSISSRRELLCLKIFDEKLGTKVIDGIIRCL